MKPPPLLLGAALLFWGWQTGFLLAGAVLAVGLESGRWIKARWEFSDEDFTRIWTFCTLVFLAAAVYAFTSSGGPADIRGLIQNPGILGRRNAAAASARTAASLIRWVPMIFFPFVATMAFSAREGVPLNTIKLILSLRWKKAGKRAQPAGQPTVNVAYPYFALCLFASCVHPGTGDLQFFGGLCALLTWALWRHRSRRFGVAAWIGALVAALALAYTGQFGLGQLQRYLDNLNSRWFSRFARHGFDPSQSRTDLGQIGRLKLSGSIVVRLDPHGATPPPLLREASYRTFKGRTWYAGVTDKDFEPVQRGPSENSWLLLAQKTNLDSVQIASYLPDGQGLLPLPSGSARLENLPAYVMNRNSLGAVLAQGPGLVIFDALYGPGAGMDSPPVREDLSTWSDRDIAALDEVIDELGLNQQDRRQKLRTLSTFFSTKFSYSTWQPASRLNKAEESALSRFLLHTRRGHCEYFATAATLLLRRSGTPARYAVGYAVHEADGNKYIVRQRDAHSWCLVWNSEHRLWQDFDPTPGGWVQAEQSLASRLQFLSDFWSRIGFEVSKFRWGQSELRQYIFWGLIPVLALLLYQILFRRRRRRAGHPAAAATMGPQRPGLDSEFYQLERFLGNRGMSRQPAMPLSEWLDRVVVEPSISRARAPLENVLALHYRYRFDPRGLDQAERERLRSQVRDCLALIAQRE